MSDFHYQVSQTGRYSPYLIDNVGVVVWYGSITGGQINRESKVWDFEAEIGPIFHAKLINGNMVDGTVRFGPGTEGSFYANYTN